MENRKTSIGLLLLVWFAANFIPHIVVFLATGQIYYQLPIIWALIVESSIMLLNLFLPVYVLRSMAHPREGILVGIGWQWTGWRVPGIGLAGFILFTGFSVATQQLIGDPISTPIQGVSGVAGLFLLVLLLVLTAAAEETMFRGYLQTTLTRDYGAWVGIGITALLFGLRHLPMDLYGGLSQHVPASAWVSRMLQLYIGAIIFGAARHWAKSTWASWIMHEGTLLLIIVLGIAMSAGA